MKNIIKKIWLSGFNGSYSEYLESKNILKKESIEINKNPLYFFGFFMYSLCIALVYFLINNKFVAILLLLLFSIGSALMTKAVSNYHYNYVNRERKKQENNRIEKQE